MDNIRFIPVSLTFSYEEVRDINKRKFQEEYNQLGEYTNESIEEWVKKLQAKGQFQDSDPIILKLLIELHKKVDRLESILKQESKELIPLQYNSKIYGIHFEYIKTQNYSFLPQNIYYARISMPTFPTTELPLYLKGITDSIAKIHIINQKNSQKWASFVMAKEREYIRGLKRRGYDT